MRFLLALAVARKCADLVETLIYFHCLQANLIPEKAKKLSNDTLKMPLKQNTAIKVRVKWRYFRYRVL